MQECPRCGMSLHETVSMCKECRRKTDAEDRAWDAARRSGEDLAEAYKRIYEWEEIR